ncbi:MAG TPA: glycosyltransferase family 2 protein [Acidimicrobiales bacterium]|nr:glycosyltransferase family 2 protein [Acidimicrobiales bacterium]
MDFQPSTPPVVAVVVALEQGEWFEETLAALGAQDYPNQSVLVIDGGATDGPVTRAPTDPASRVAAVLPDAYMRRPSGRPGFAALANDCLTTVQGAAFLVFCHDDVALAPDAIRLLVEEALRSNAGIVGPKLVDWDDPTRLLAVGLNVDKTAATRSLVDRGELDQEQHDAVRDVFAVPSAAMLVRCDLFFTLGGFDASMDDHGADVDLCWRAQMAGARVIVAPAAVARHFEGGAEASGDQPDHIRFLARNHLRTMFKNYSFFHLVRVLPQAAAVTVVEAIIAVVNRRWAEARALLAAWPWNLRHLGHLRAERRVVKASRSVPDSEVRRLQVRSSVRMSAYLRRRLDPEERARALVSAGQQLVSRVGNGPAQAATALLVVMVLAVVIGSRFLFRGGLPAVGQLAPFPGVSNLLSQYVHGWRTTGMGAGAATPPAFGALGLGGLVLLGHVSLLQKILILATWPVAAVGAWRLGHVLRSGLGRLVLVVVYLAVPLSYNSLARGHWDGLIAYAAAPFLLRRLGHLAGLAPFATEGDDDPHRRRTEILGFALALATLGAFVPSIALAVLLVAVGLVLGSAVVGEVGAAGRGLAAAAVALVGALVLLLPWSLEQLGGGWAALVGAAPPASRAVGLGALLRFQIGPIGAGPLGWAVLVAAALPLVLAQGWRLAWAVRCWAVALLSVGVAWAGGRGWFPIHPQSPDVLLAPAAVALAAAAALGAAAFEFDLSGYRFGWRQMASAVAGVAVVMAALPILTAARDGRWGLPAIPLSQSLTYTTQKPAEGSFRTLWLGDPEVLPLGSWGMGGGLAYATSRDGTPVGTDNLPGPASDATRTIVTAIGQAELGDTSRLGRLLAPMAVRYVVLPRQLAAGDVGGPQRPPPVALTQGLASQLDLRLLPSDPAAIVYENTAWGPARESTVAAKVPADPPASLDSGADLSGGTPVLPGRGPIQFAGNLPSAGQVLVSEAPSSRWQLSVAGKASPRTPAFGVANAYQVTGAGHGVLRYRTPLFRYALVALGIALWLGALQVLTRLRRRMALRAPAGPAGPANPADRVTPVTPTAPAPVAVVGAPTPAPPPGPPGPVVDGDRP